MDRHGDHAAVCAYGALRIRRHDAYADLLSDIVAETGAHVLREAYVKAFSTADREARLDIWAFGGMHVEDLLIDVTIRHPMSSPYQPRAASESGAAAKLAEEQKQATLVWSIIGYF